MPKTTQLNIRPSARALTALDYLKAQTGMSYTEIIENAVIEFAKETKMEQVTIAIWRPQQDIPGVNGFFAVKNAPDGKIARLVECAACEGAPGRWEYDPSVLYFHPDGETARATVRWVDAD